MELSLVKLCAMCPICGNYKAPGQLACGKCRKVVSLKNGGEAIKIIETKERELQAADRLLHGVLRDMVNSVPA